MTDKIERGHQAAGLLNPEGVFAECVQKLEAAYIAQWREAKSLDDREDLHRKLTLITDLQNELRNVMMTGEIAAQEQEQPKRGIFQW